MTMVVVPYTRRTWRVYMAFLFIVTAWWVQSWAWFSITGLLLADAVMNMNFKAKAERGVKILRSVRIPSLIVYGILLAVGLVMQYLWAAWRPDLRDNELRAHTGLYHTGGLNEDFDASQPQARDDNYFLLLGFFLLLESSEVLQWIFSNPLFVYLGKRSLSKLIDNKDIEFEADSLHRLAPHTKYCRLYYGHQALPVSPGKECVGCWCYDGMLFCLPPGHLDPW